MDQNNKNNPPSIIWSFEKTSSVPNKTHGFYRSRIYTSDININPLIAACDPLFSLTVNLKDTEIPNNNDKLLQDLVHEIRSFEHQAKLASYEEETIISARYALCALLDETISQTTWGKSNWTNNELLSFFHNEKNSDEKFFNIIEHSLKDIATNLHLIELLYVCLNCGFIGKYKHSHNDTNELLATTDKLYQIIKQYSYRNPTNILIYDDQSKIKQHSIDSQITTTKPNNRKLFGIALAIAIATSGLIYLSFSLKLNQFSAPVYNTLEQLQNNSESNL